MCFSISETILISILPHLAPRTAPPYLAYNQYPLCFCLVSVLIFCVVYIDHLFSRPVWTFCLINIRTTVFLTKFQAARVLRMCCVTVFDFFLLLFLAPSDNRMQIHFETQTKSNSGHTNVHINAFHRSDCTQWDYCTDWTVDDTIMWKFHIRSYSVWPGGSELDWVSVTSKSVRDSHPRPAGEWW